MSDRGEPDAELTPAEQRLLGLLTLLREAPPEPDEGLTRAVMRRARWEAGVRSALRNVGGLAAAAAESVSVLLGRRSGSPRR